MSYSYVYHKPTSSPRKNSLTNDDATLLSQGITELNTKSTSSKGNALTSSSRAPEKGAIEPIESCNSKPNPYLTEAAKMKARMAAASLAAGSSSSKQSFDQGNQRSRMVLKLGYSTAPSKPQRTVAMWRQEREAAANSGTEDNNIRPAPSGGRFTSSHFLKSPNSPFAAKVSTLSGDPERPETQQQSGKESSPPIDPNRVPNDSFRKNPPRPLSYCKIVKQCEHCKMLFNVHHVCSK